MSSYTKMKKITDIKTRVFRAIVEIDNPDETTRRNIRDRVQEGLGRQISDLPVMNEVRQMLTAGEIAVSGTVARNNRPTETLVMTDKGRELFAQLEKGAVNVRT